MAQPVAGTLTPQPVSIPAIPLNEIMPWALFGGLLMLLAIYFVGAEQGATIVGVRIERRLHALLGGWNVSLLAGVIFLLVTVTVAHFST